MTLKIRYRDGRWQVVSDDGHVLYESGSSTDAADWRAEYEARIAA